MYICIEGIKGSGKTTLVNELKYYFERSRREFEIASPTKPIPNSYVERIFKIFRFLRRIDVCNEYLYAARSNYVGKNIDWNCNLIIGDRSIITSYVTRWYKWSTPEICVERVNRLEKHIKVPDYIIFLDISVEKALERIKNRKRDYGSTDETPERLQQAISAYKEIYKIGLDKLRKIEHKSKWFFVNADQAPKELFYEVVAIIENIIRLQEKSLNEML